MGESSSSHHHQRLGLRNRGEIVEVQGGHILRSTGRKDRHSKVCTSKGPRDRRVRLAAHTAIQFYDVQDRLGYDRPSKAVDWLISKAKAAIDELDRLPPWNPTDCSVVTANFKADVSKIESDLGISDKIRANAVDDEQRLGFHQNSSFLPPSLDSDDIAEGSSSAMAFASSQDLRLSLQSFADPILLHQHQNPNPPNHQQTQVLLGFDGTSGWASAEHHQRFDLFNSGGDTGEGAGYFFNQTTPPPAPPFIVQHSQNQFYTQRGPLQSSITPSVRAWMDPSAIAELHHHHPIFHPPPISGGFSGFHIPTRIQGEEEEHDGYSDKPSSASSDSHH